MKKINVFTCFFYGTVIAGCIYLGFFLGSIIHPGMTLYTFIPVLKGQMANPLKIKVTSYTPYTMAAVFLTALLSVMVQKTNQKIARKAEIPIIPVVLEYKENDCYVKFGSPVYITKNDSKQNKIDELSDKMASMKWEIWEMFPVISRTEIDEQEWEREVRKRIMEYPKLNYEYEKSCIRKYINETV